VVAAAFLAIVMTLLVGVYTGVIPPPAIFDPRRRAQLADELAGREPREFPPRPPSSTAQQLLLIGFFLSVVAMAAGAPGIRALGLVGVLATLAAIIVIRVRRERRAAELRALETDEYS
jgi:hypothetical protein